MTFSERTMEAHAEKIFGKNFGRKKATLRWLSGNPRVYGASVICVETLSSVRMMDFIA
jgi:hypothetical protein